MKLLQKKTKRRQNIQIDLPVNKYTQGRVGFKDVPEEFKKLCL